jgi:hypothetical protein
MSISRLTFIEISRRRSPSTFSSRSMSSRTRGRLVVVPGLDPLGRIDVGLAQIRVAVARRSRRCT